jgi:hypothetical protein
MTDAIAGLILVVFGGILFALVILWALELYFTVHDIHKMLSDNINTTQTEEGNGDD